MIIHELWTDKIEESGISKRMFFHCLIEIDGVKEWHYFGTTTVEKPPTQPYPVNEYGYVQFPRDLDDLDKREADDLLYQMGQMAGLKREGIAPKPPIPIARGGFSSGFNSGFEQKET